VADFRALFEDEAKFKKIFSSSYFIRNHATKGAFIHLKNNKPPVEELFAVKLSIQTENGGRQIFQSILFT